MGRKQIASAVLGVTAGILLLVVVPVLVVLIDKYASQTHRHAPTPDPNHHGGAPINPPTPDLKEIFLFPFENFPVRSKSETTYCKGQRVRHRPRTFTGAVDYPSPQDIQTYAQSMGYTIPNEADFRSFVADGANWCPFGYLGPVHWGTAQFTLSLLGGRMKAGDTDTIFECQGSNTTSPDTTAVVIEGGPGYYETTILNQLIPQLCCANVQCSPNQLQGFPTRGILFYGVKPPPGAFPNIPEYAPGQWSKFYSVPGNYA